MFNKPVTRSIIDCVFNCLVIVYLIYTDDAIGMI